LGEGATNLVWRRGEHESCFTDGIGIEAAFLIPGLLFFFFIRADHYLRPAAVKAGILIANCRRRFGFHNTLLCPTCFLLLRQCSVDGTKIEKCGYKPMDSAKPSDANIQLMQLTNAFWTSRCLHVVAEIGVADHLNEKSESTDSLAQSTGTHPESLYRVLRLLASQGIFAWKDGAWLHTGASRLLRADHPASMRDYIRMIGMPVFWHAWEELEYSVRTGRTAFQKIHPAGVFAYLSEHPEQSRIFNASMTSKAHRDIAAVL
jgi:hypothetical protein